MPVSLLKLPLPPDETSLPDDGALPSVLDRPCSRNSVGLSSGMVGQDLRGALFVAPPPPPPPEEELPDWVLLADVADDDVPVADTRGPVPSYIGTRGCCCCCGCCCCG